MWVYPLSITWALYAVCVALCGYGLSDIYVASILPVLPHEKFHLQYLAMTIFSPKQVNIQCSFRLYVQDVHNYSGKENKNIYNALSTIQNKVLCISEMQSPASSEESWDPYIMKAYQSI